MPKPSSSSLILTLAFVLTSACNGDAPNASTSTIHPENPASASLSASAAPSSSAPPVASASETAAPSAAPVVVASASAAPSILDAGVARHHKDAGAAEDAGAVAIAPSADAGTPPALGAPEAGSADEVAAKVDEIFANQKTFKATFKQEYVAKVSNTTKKSTGTVIVLKPGKISFRYDPPNQNRIVSDGTILKVYLAEDSQMFTQPVGNSEYPGAMAFIMGHGLRPSFTFTFNDKAKFDGGPVLIGKPRQPTPSYEFVQFTIDKTLLEKKDPGVIRRVLVVDAQGNKNRFDFDGATQPSAVDASEFVFSPPAGTTITQP